MAITLEANYAKKLGLPNFSSHQYFVTIRTELTDLSQVEAERGRAGAGSVAVQAKRAAAVRPGAGREPLGMREAAFIRRKCLFAGAALIPTALWSAGPRLMRAGREAELSALPFLPSL